MVERRFDLTKDAVTATEIADASVTTSKLASNAVKVTIPIVGVHDQNGLAADSTGVKYEGPRFRINTTGLKSATLRATWTSSATDSQTNIELFDVTSGTILNNALFGNSGTDSETSITSSITSGDLFELRVEVTAASATSGATTDVKYGVLELTYGFS